MKLQLTTVKKADGFTAGLLHIDGVEFCHTLEDTTRDLLAGCHNKVPAKTAIPPGTYNLVLSFSNRFQKYMPEILAVPCFLGIRIHGGNAPADTEGCILVGFDKTEDGTIAGGTSRPAFDALMRRLKLAEKKEKITITIER